MTIIAIATYGSHRVNHPRTGQKVSAYKIGYSSAASAVLLALYRNEAQDVSSKHASYHYVQINADVTVRRGYILLKVTNDELTRAESVTIKTHRPAVYRWMEGAWHELPSRQVSDYQPAAGRSGPDFDPTGIQIVSASTGEVEAAVAGITVERSQRGEQDKPWYWLRGDTYPHREGNTRIYTAYMQNIPEAKFTSLILLYDLVTQPNYGGKSTTFILITNEAQWGALQTELFTLLENDSSAVVNWLREHRVVFPSFEIEVAKRLITLMSSQPQALPDVHTEGATYTSPSKPEGKVIPFPHTEHEQVTVEEAPVRQLALF